MVNLNHKVMCRFDSQVQTTYFRESVLTGMSYKITEELLYRSASRILWSKYAPSSIQRFS